MARAVDLHQNRFDGNFLSENSLGALMHHASE